MEFSKKTTMLSWGVALTLTTIVVIFPVLGWPYDGALTALPYSWLEVGVDHAFYKWKAKNENRHKHAILFVKEISDKHGIEMALRFAEVVLNH